MPRVDMSGIQQPNELAGRNLARRPQLQDTTPRYAATRQALRATHHTLRATQPAPTWSAPRDPIARA
jgi:hypothetical protein